MKILLSLLLASNLLFWGYTHFSTAGKDPHKLEAQDINGQRLTLLQPGWQAEHQARLRQTPPKHTAGGATEEALPSPLTPEGPLPYSAPDRAGATDNDTGLATAATQSICLIWHGLRETEVPRLRQQLAQLNLGGEISLSLPDLRKKARFWVYIPPRESLVEATQMQQKLAARHIESVVLNTGGAMQNAISLGVFQTQEAAQNHLNTLRQQEVFGAKVGPRDDSDLRGHVLVQHVRTSAQARLTELAAAYPGHRVERIACSGESAS